MEEEATSMVRVAESQTKAPHLQLEWRVLALQLKGIQAKLQHHQCNHADFVGSTQRGVLHQGKIDTEQESEN